MDESIGFLKNFQSLLALLYRINAADRNKEMHAIRVLPELASRLDIRSLRHLISCGEYPVSRAEQKGSDLQQEPETAIIQSLENLVRSYSCPQRL